MPENGGVPSKKIYCTFTRYLNSEINTLLTSLLLKICGIHLFFIKCVTLRARQIYCILQVLILPYT